MKLKTHTTRQKALSCLKTLALWGMEAALALLVLVCTEWIHRGSLEGAWNEYIHPHLRSYQAAWLLLFLVYKLAEGIFRRHWAALLVTSAAGCVPAAVTFYKNQLRGEPFFPWDLAQASEATDVMTAAGLKLQHSMLASMLLLGLLAFALFFLQKPKRGWKRRLLAILWPAAALAGLVCGVFLNGEVSQVFLRVTPDMWYQTRYYRWYGVITAFLTNAQNLQIDKPVGYSQQSVQALVEQTQAAAEGAEPLYESSYAAQTDSPVEQPDIIYIMDESFWDVSELEELGVVFDQPVTPNLTALRETSAYGRVYSPSFGGGTCDVEFEALTGYSKEFLPAGSKPFQQHVTQPMFSLPNYLKDQGYQTAAVHGYYKKFWSRVTAYPNLGLDVFVGLDDMQDPELKRTVYWGNGLVTDAEMGRQIESLYESMLQSSEAPVFLHAVTMQNHTSYNVDNYPDSERVRVLEAPAGMSQETIGALEDFATGVREADQLLGDMVAYFSAQERPVILAFWGDHYNPIGSSMEVYTATGYASDSNQDPAVHGMPLLLWSNYSDCKVEFGTLGTYALSPLLMDLFGLEKPLFFDYLLQQQSQGYASRTLGVTVQTDGETATTDPLTAEQQVWFQNHWLWQYDLMFGEEYSLGENGWHNRAG